jgi:hypothetical protein
VGEISKSSEVTLSLELHLGLSITCLINCKNLCKCKRMYSHQHNNKGKIKLKRLQIRRIHCINSMKERLYSEEKKSLKEAVIKISGKTAEKHGETEATEIKQQTVPNPFQLPRTRSSN